MPEFVGQMPSRALPWSTMGAVQQVKQYSQGVAITAEAARLMISILASNLIRVRIVPLEPGQFSDQAGQEIRRSWAVARRDTDWPEVEFGLQESGEKVEITTPEVRIQVEKATGKLTCFDSANRPFAADTDLGLGWQFQQNSARICAWKRIEADEHYYGFGERSGGLDKLGRTLTNWTVDSLDYTGLTDAMYQAIPFFMALRPEVGYGLFLNCTGWSSFDIGSEQTGVWQMQAHSRELDYYLIYGPEPAQILETYTELTGRMPLPPHWALGYHQCRWSYRSEAEVRELATQFRQRQIPCDVIHLDIDYMDGFRVFTWNPQRFPDPAQLLGDLRQDGFQVVTIVDPGVKFQPDDPYGVLESGLQQDYFVRHSDGRIFHGYVWPDRSVFPDFLRPDVRHWWSQQHRALIEAGVAGIWNDMNEPALNDRPFGDPGVKVAFPLDAPQGDESERSTHAETHNLYGQMMARAAAEALQTLRPQQRSFVLTRSGFAGIQRWSAVWTGDNHSRWEYLEMSLPMLCNLGLSGVAFVGVDIGGFSGNATAELFARWMQVGMLYPMMRAHTANTSMQHEPWVFGPQVEQICRTYIELRYRLLPYLYTLFWQAANTGAPILRPMLYEFPQDRAVTQLYDQVMLGPAILAAPILRPGVEARAVYLPEGVWFDWWTGEPFQGPTHILAHAPLETMPLYVRAGSIIPMAPVRQHTGEPLDHLWLKIWPGRGEWTHYEDDGSSFDYQQGAWTTRRYRVETEGQTVTVTLEARSGDWQPQPRRLIVEVVGMGEQTVEEDGAARTLTFDRT